MKRSYVALILFGHKEWLPEQSNYMKVPAAYGLIVAFAAYALDWLWYVLFGYTPLLDATKTSRYWKLWSAVEVIFLYLFFYYLLYHIYRFPKYVAGNEDFFVHRKGDLLRVLGVFLGILGLWVFLMWFTTHLGVAVLMP